MILTMSGITEWIELKYTILRRTNRTHLGKTRMHTCSAKLRQTKTYIYIYIYIQVLAKWVSVRSSQHCIFQFNTVRNISHGPCYVQVLVSHILEPLAVLIVCSSRPIVSWVRMSFFSQSNSEKIAYSSWTTCINYTAWLRSSVRVQSKRVGCPVILTLQGEKKKEYIYIYTQMYTCVIYIYIYTLTVNFSVKLFMSC